MVYLCPNNQLTFIMTIDITASKKLLLEEFRELYPNATKEDEAAFYTAMTWLENEMDLEHIKQNILDELDRKNPNLPSQRRKAFAYGLDRLGLVYNDADTISDRLQEYLPEKAYNSYLKKSLMNASELVAENTNLKEENNKLNNKINNLLILPKSELNKLRHEKEYNRLNAELQEQKRINSILLSRLLAKEYGE